MSILDKLKAALKRKPKESQPKEPQPHPGGASLWQFHLLMTVWAFSLAGSLWMLLVFIAGSVGRVDWSSAYEATNEATKTNTWSFIMEIHWTVAVGLFLFCLAIAVYNAVWLELRRHIAPGVVKNALTAIGCCVALFMISGATVVQQRGTDARARDDVIAAQSAQAGAAGVQAQINAVQADLDRLTDKTKNNEYAATAATVGEKMYRQSYMSAEALARSPRERRDIIVRALGAAQQSDALKAERARLASLLTTASVATVVEEARTVRATGFMAEATSVMEDVRKPVTAILGELLAMTVFSAALAAWASRQQALSSVAPAAEEASPLMIEEIREGDIRYDLPADAGPIVTRQKKQRIWDEEKQAFVVERKATYAKVPTRKSKRAGDETEYETPAVMSGSDPRAVHLQANAEDDEAENMLGLRNDETGIPDLAGQPISSEPDAVRDRDLVAADDSAVSIEAPDAQADGASASDSVSTDWSDVAGSAQSVQRELEPADERVSVRSAEQFPDEPSAIATPHPEIDERPADEPVVLSDERYDELEARGVIVDGEFVSQEDQDIIEQDDQAVVYPALPAPREKEVA